MYILDRLKDLIIRGGENIDCSEVVRLYSEPIQSGLYSEPIQSGTGR